VTRGGSGAKAPPLDAHPPEDRLYHLWGVRLKKQRMGIYSQDISVYPRPQRLIPTPLTSRCNLLLVLLSGQVKSSLGRIGEDMSTLSNSKISLILGPEVQSSTTQALAFGKKEGKKEEPAPERSRHQKDLRRPAIMRPRLS